MLDRFCWALPSISQEFWQILELLMVFFTPVEARMGFLVRRVFSWIRLHMLHNVSGRTMASQHCHLEEKEFFFSNIISLVPLSTTAVLQLLSNDIHTVLVLCQIFTCRLNCWTISGSLFVSLLIAALRFFWQLPNLSTLFSKWDISVQRGLWKWNFPIIRGGDSIFLLPSLMTLCLHLQITLAFSDSIPHA